MAVKLHDAGHFTWKDWAARLADEIAAAAKRGEHDDGSRYYHHLAGGPGADCREKGLVSSEELASRKDQ
jgi:hypothetical protein